MLITRFLTASAVSLLAACGGEPTQNGDDNGSTADEAQSSWTWTISGDREHRFEGDGYKFYSYSDRGQAYIQLDPYRKGDMEFNSKSFLVMMFKTESINGSGAAPVEAGDANLSYASGEGGDFDCRAQSPGEVRFERYDDERMTGSYESTMTCDGGDEVRVAADFDLVR